LLDTTLLIDVERSGSALDELIGDDDDVAIAAISVAELEVGVEMAKGKTRRTRHEFLEQIIEEIPVLPYDLLVARAHASLLVAVRLQGRPRGAHDLMIAATALASDRSMVSADRSAFVDLPGLKLVSYD
jgi:tRNA(fMet)-specific endonuclease VapC